MMALDTHEQPLKQRHADSLWVGRQVWHSRPVCGYQERLRENSRAKAGHYPGFAPNFVGATVGKTEHIYYSIEC